MLIVPDMDDAIVNTVYERCPDTSIGQAHGSTYIAFDREAASLDAAIDSAVEDLRRLNIEPIRIEMDVPEPATAS